MLEGVLIIVFVLFFKKLFIYNLFPLEIAIAEKSENFCNPDREEKFISLTQKYLYNPDFYCTEFLLVSINIFSFIGQKIFCAKFFVLIFA